jgi:hypothetical protein
MGDAHMRKFILLPAEAVSRLTNAQPDVHRVHGDLARYNMQQGMLDKKPLPPEIRKAEYTQNLIEYLTQKRIQEEPIKLEILRELLDHQQQQQQQQQQQADEDEAPVDQDLPPAEHLIQQRQPLPPLPTTIEEYRRRGFPVHQERLQRRPYWDEQPNYDIGNLFRSPRNRSPSLLPTPPPSSGSSSSAYAAPLSASTSSTALDHARVDLTDKMNAASTSLQSDPYSHLPTIASPPPSSRTRQQERLQRQQQQRQQKQQQHRYGTSPGSYFPKKKDYDEDTQTGSGVRRYICHRWEPY